MLKKTKKKRLRKIPTRKPKKRIIPSEHKQWKGVQKGVFTPRHPEKYKGNVKNIVYRSSWERSFMNFLDNNVSIIQWGSEIIIIPYRKPTTGRIHKYYPDFWIKYKNKSGEIIQQIVEIKPSKQIHPPKKSRGKSNKTLVYEQITHNINVAKWRACKIFCENNNIEFKILSEKELFR